MQAVPHDLATGVRVKLSVMMFLQYAFNGIWIIPLGTYLNAVGYSGNDIGRAYSTSAIGCILAPFFVGMIADKFFAAEKLLAVLNLAGGALLLLAARLSVDASGHAHAGGLGVCYWVLLLHFLCYMPTWALTNTIALRQLSNPTQQFPSIRVMGTIGWVVVSSLCLFGANITRAFGASGSFEATAVPMYIGALIGLAAGVVAFGLPHTPPQGDGSKVSAADILGLKALALFRDRNYAIFALTSFLIMFAGLFHWSMTNLYLNESKMNFAQFWQSSGQMSETIFLFVMPLFFRRFGVKNMLMMGLVAWIVRFVCFSFGVWQSGTWVLVFLGLLLHGPCFDFFFVTGQLYTDRKASKDIQAQAQGLISLLTFGLGWFFGSKLAGAVVDHYAVKDSVGKVVGHAWHSIWLVPIAIVAVIIVIFGGFFNDNLRVGHDDAPDETVEEELERETAL